MTPTRVIAPHTKALLAAAALLLLAACASVPPPTSLMQRAQQQLDAAEQAQAADYAPVDLTFAKQRYQSAQAAMNDSKYALARDMANESLADGRLAQTRAELAAVREKIQKQNAENKRLQAQLLNPPKPDTPAPGAQGSSNGGLPAQIVLPQPASSALAPPSTLDQSSTTPDQQPTTEGQP